MGKWALPLLASILGEHMASILASILGHILASILGEHVAIHRFLISVRPYLPHLPSQHSISVRPYKSDLENTSWSPSAQQSGYGSNGHIIPPLLAKPPPFTCQASPLYLPSRNSNKTGDAVPRFMRVNR